MTKQEMLCQVKNGKCIQDIFLLCAGQGCSIFKEKEFEVGENIIYIPDLSLYDIAVDEPILDTEDQLQLISHCYTGTDFLAASSNNPVLAENLFDWCDWQSPESALPEVMAAYNSDSEPAFFG